jgi:hypothetical protein
MPTSLNCGTQGAPHRFNLNITQNGECNSSDSAERHSARCIDSAAKNKTLFEHSLEDHFRRVRSLLGRINLRSPSRIEAHVSIARPLIAITTSHSLLKERTFFLERLQQALG